MLEIWALCGPIMGLMVGVIAERYFHNKYDHRRY